MRTNPCDAVTIPSLDSHDDRAGAFAAPLRGVVDLPVANKQADVKV